MKEFVVAHRRRVNSVWYVILSAHPARLRCEPQGSPEIRARDLAYPFHTRKHVLHCILIRCPKLTLPDTDVRCVELSASLFVSIDQHLSVRAVANDPTTRNVTPLFPQCRAMSGPESPIGKMLPTKSA